MVLDGEDLDSPAAGGKRVDTGQNLCSKWEEKVNILLLFGLLNFFLEEVEENRKKTIYHPPPTLPAN